MTVQEGDDQWDDQLVPLRAVFPSGSLRDHSWKEVPVDATDHWFGVGVLAGFVLLSAMALHDKWGDENGESREENGALRVAIERRNHPDDSDVPRPPSEPRRDR